MPSERLETGRLILRKPHEDDISAFVPLIGDFDVSKNLSRVPHPYSDADAREFIARVHTQRAEGNDYNFAIARRSDDAYLGTCGVHRRETGWEFGYWLGKPYWGQGYATEAARCLVRFAFDELRLPVLIAGWFYDNPASGRVLAKLGCVPDGAEQRNCLARGHAVNCYNVRLEREAFERSAS